jgi:4-diphosphocytidyl-2-C-methyl-D-erythritol kinase
MYQAVLCGEKPGRSLETLVENKSVRLQSCSMPVTLRSFAKINIGLCIGSARSDGFHDLLTVYQTIGLHDLVTVRVVRGSGIEIRCDDSRVPTDNSNTCFKIVEKARSLLRPNGKIIIEIQKRLPVQGGLGGASSNAVATLLALERAVNKPLSPEQRLRIAAEVGSDLPLFLIGGTVLGVGRGEQVYPLPNLPAIPCVVVTPQVGVSTPKAFAAWDSKLTGANASDRMIELGRKLSSWLGEFSSGAPQSRRYKPRGRAENPLLALVRTGIENDFEQVVFPEYPELRDVKRALERAGAIYASLSGSGSSLYGLFESAQTARTAAAKMRKQGWAAQPTVTVTSRRHWDRMFK